MCTWNEAHIRVVSWLRSLDVPYQIGSDSENDFWILRELVTKKGSEAAYGALCGAWLNLGSVGIRSLAIENTAQLFNVIDEGAHNALADARALRATWLREGRQ